MLGSHQLPSLLLSTLPHHNPAGATSQPHHPSLLTRPGSPCLCRCRLPEAGDCAPRLRIITHLFPITQAEADALLAKIKSTGYALFADLATVELLAQNLGEKYAPKTFAYNPPPPGGRVQDSVCLMPPERRSPASTCALLAWKPLTQTDAVANGICSPTPPPTPSAHTPACPTLLCSAPVCA